MSALAHIPDEYNALNSLKIAIFPAMLVVLALLASCSTVKPAGPSPRAATETPAAPAHTAEQAKQEPTPDEYPVRPFTKDELYDLLVAELAGYRGHYDTALHKYLAVTKETRDPGVAARTTRLAAYLKHDHIALQAATIWSQVEPKDVDAHRYAADLLMRAGDIKGAVAHLEAIKRLGGDPDFPMFAYRAANLSKQDRDTLIDGIDKLAKEFPDDTELQFSKAVLLEQNGQLEDALAVTNQLLAKKLDVKTVLLKVNALKSLHRNKEAMTFLQRTVKQVKDNRRLRLIYARLLFENNRLNDARRQYEIVHEQSPGDGDILFALALISLEQKDYPTAHKYLEEMLHYHRRVGEAHFYLGTIAEQNKDYASALNQYKQVDDGYEFLPAQARIASILFDEGKEQEARTWLETARANHPDRYDQLIIIEAQLLSDHGKKDQVFSFLNNAIEADPDNTDLLYFRAMTGEKFGRLDILERDLKQIIRIDPNNADALNALGYTLTDQTDRHEEALKLIQRALKLKPNEPAYIDSLGWAMYRLKHYDQAVIELKKALRLYPNDEVAAHLGEVLWVTGKKAEANKVWQNALQRKPDSQVLKKVIHKFTGR